MAYRLVLASYLICVAAVCVFSDQKYAPLPEKIVTAKTVFLQNDSGVQKFADNVYRQLEQWGRWRVVKNRSDADVVVALDHQERVQGSGYGEVFRIKFTCVSWMAGLVQRCGRKNEM